MLRQFVRHALFVACIAFAGPAWSQSAFTQVLNDPLATTPGDSRSVNIVDVNNDGWDDVFISNGLQGGQNNELYINKGNGAFSKVSSGDIVNDKSPSDGATFADADNDGDLDAFVVTWYNALNYYYANDGKGNFTYLPQAGTGNLGTYSETAAFADYDNDGLVDLYITNSEGPNFRNLLYRNTGNHVYQRITGSAWLNTGRPGRSANWADYDNDGDQDLFVANENDQPNYLFRNDGPNGFAIVTGSPLTSSARSSMTGSWGDIDNDGDQDLFVGNTKFYEAQNNELYINKGDGTFETAPSGPVQTDGGCTYGSAMTDYDNDGDLDLFVANGFCNGNIVNFLYKNDGKGKFERDLTSLPTFATPCSFGAAWGDLNNDGFQDLVVSACKNASASPQPNKLFFLNKGNGNHWLKIKLTGSSSNRSAIGAQIRVKALIGGQTVTQMREISAQTGYCGQNSLTAHFGLLDASKVQSVEVRWPSGLKETWNDVGIDQTLTLTEGKSTAIEGTNPLPVFRMKVSPNPVTGALRWELHADEPADSVRFSLLSPDGKICAETYVKNISAGAHRFQLPLARIASGMYFLRADAPGKGSETVRVIIP